jgi:hypothetical protein
MALAAVALLALAGGAAAAGAPPTVSEDNARFVLANDHVKVQFEGKKPTLRILPADAKDANATGAFTYRFLDVVEYRDLDNNGAPSPGEVVATLNLDRADGWKAERASTDGAAILNLTLADDAKAANAPDLPKPPVGLPADRAAQVSLVFTLRGDDATLPAGVASLPVRASSVKYDLVVTKWPFLDAANDRLALESDVTGGVKGTNATGVETAAVATANGTAVGSLSWTTLAEGKTAAGATVAVPVHAALQPQSDATGAATGVTRLVFTYDAPGLASLVHDPTIGLFPTTVLGLDGGVAGAGTLKPTPGPGLVVAVGAAAVGALALRRR